MIPNLFYLFIYLFIFKPACLTPIVGEQLHLGILVSVHISMWAMWARLTFGWHRSWWNILWASQEHDNISKPWRASTQLVLILLPGTSEAWNFPLHPQIHLQDIGLLKLRMEWAPPQQKSSLLLLFVIWLNQKWCPVGLGSRSRTGLRQAMWLRWKT